MNADFSQLMQQAQALEAASRAFPLRDVLIVVAFSTCCIALLLVLAWFLFKTRFPRSFDGRR